MHSAFPASCRAHSWTSRVIAGICLTFPALACAQADEHATGVPAYSSRPGAEFTIYLDVAGFNYTGDWGNDPGGTTPGVTPALNNVPSTGSFSTDDQTQIGLLFARVAQSYIGFNVNVTTVDPAGPGLSDAQRQAFYDATPNMMHTVIGSGLRSGPGTNWQGSGDGVSGIGVMTGVAPSAGVYNHTNWMFSEDQTPGGTINGDYIGAVVAHENGHAFGLYHQGDWTGGTNVNEYSNGDADPGIGSYVPILGNASDRQRVTWRVGSTGGPSGTLTTANDVQNLIAINNPTATPRAGAAALHYVDDGIGHTAGAATALPLNGTAIDFTAAAGVIVPKSESNPEPIGANNYTTDWFSFSLDSTSIVTLTSNNSTQFITPGQADGTGTLRSTLSLWDGTGVSLIGDATEDPSTLFTTFSGTLGAGSYLARIGSFGGHAEVSPAFNAAQYYDMGAYFLTGSLIPVPEPGVIGLLAGGLLFGFRRRRSQPSGK